MTKLAILGSGMAAFGAAHRLHGEPVEIVLYDKSQVFGGHTVSLKYPQGFIFDVGPHVSFTKDKRIQQIFAASIEDEFETHDYRFSNYWQGHWIGHPAQTNLYGLPADVIIKVIADFVEQGTKQIDVRNYRDWLIASYGAAFAEWFPERYTLKYHTTGAANLTTDWMGPRMYRPRLDEVLRGALSPSSPNVHYIHQFRYPRRGGFGAYLGSWATLWPPRLNHEVIAIEPKQRRLRFSNGREDGYDALVSSIPLPEVVKLVQGTPPDVFAAAEQLACSSCVLVNLGLKRNDLATTHISYFYDLDIIFPRVSFPHMMSARNAPPGCGSIQVEIYFSKKYRPCTAGPADYIEPAIRDLVRCGVVREDEEFLVRDAMFVPYANIIFDHDRAAALATVHGYLDDVGVNYCGRYGAWGYYWTDDSFKSGENAAERALSQLGRQARCSVPQPVFTENALGTPIGGARS
jgi:protoporphyrinogen oxidase